MAIELSVFGFSTGVWHISDTILSDSATSLTFYESFCSWIISIKNYWSLFTWQIDGLDKSNVTNVQRFRSNERIWYWYRQKKPRDRIVLLPIMAKNLGGLHTNCNLMPPLIRDLHQNYFYLCIIGQTHAQFSTHKAKLTATVLDKFNPARRSSWTHGGKVISIHGLTWIWLAGRLRI